MTIGSPSSGTGLAAGSSTNLGTVTFAGTGITPGSTTVTLTPSGTGTNDKANANTTTAQSVTVDVLANRSLTVNGGSSLSVGRVMQGYSTTVSVATLAGDPDNTHATQLNTQLGPVTDSYISANWTAQPGNSMFNGPSQSGTVGVSFNNLGKVTSGSLNLAGATALITNGEAASVGAVLQAANLAYSATIVTNRPLSVGGSAYAAGNTNYSIAAMAGAAAGTGTALPLAGSTWSVPLWAASGDNNYTMPVMGTTQIASGGVTLTGSPTSGGSFADASPQQFVKVQFPTTDVAANAGIDVTGLIGNENLQGPGQSVNGGAGNLQISWPAITAVGQASVYGSPTAYGTRGGPYGTPLVALIAGGGSYNGLQSMTTSSGSIQGTLGTFATLFGTNNTINTGTVQMSWRNRQLDETYASPVLPPGASFLASDVLDLTTDASGVVSPFTLEMGVDTALFPSLAYAHGLADEGDIYLGYFNTTTGKWANAIVGNIGGTPDFLGDVNPSTITPSTSTLSEWGYWDNGTNLYVWAVLNHNSEYAAVPEPGTLALLGIGCLGLGLVLVRRKRT